MKPALELTSVPDWAIAVRRPDADLSGMHWTVVAFGSSDPLSQAVVAQWRGQIAAAHPRATVRVHVVDADSAAASAVTADLSTAVVGWRLLIVGPADACLRLRAHALRGEVCDDEITVASTTVAIRDIQCVHCRATTRAAVDLEEVVGCVGCGRNLVAYYHVSRLQGAHLGFMVDAEQAGGGPLENAS